MGNIIDFISPYQALPTTVFFCDVTADSNIVCLGIGAITGCQSGHRGLLHLSAANDDVHHTALKVLSFPYTSATLPFDQSHRCHPLYEWHFETPTDIIQPECSKA